LSTHDWPAEFNDEFSSSPSTVQRRAWREVFGEEYPEGVEPYSYVSVTELHRFAEELRIGADDRLLDVGCGRGGPGLWVAAKTGARILGLDVADSALIAARSRASELDLGSRADYRVGSFEDTGLEDAGVDAIMSVDALLFTPDKRLALAELGRVLRPGGRLVFTSWDYHAQPAGRPPQVDDHRPPLRAAGFEVLAYDETDDWDRRGRETTSLLLQAVEELAAESASDVDEVRRELEEMQATLDVIERRVFVVAERPD
jgi:SAM-dependent methyltransferase